jgi:hypothetical protein
VELSELLSLTKIGGQKYAADAGLHSLMSPGLVAETQRYPTADPDARDELEKRFIAFFHSYLYFLKTDAAVPARIRQSLVSLGLCKDEFADNQHWPYSVCVREARRMAAMSILSQQDLESEVVKRTSISVGYHSFTMYPVGRVAWDGVGIQNEGNFYREVKPYEIPYESLVPKKEDCINLLSCVCIGASHVAYSSLSFEPVLMSLGQVAGSAAATCAKENRKVQELPVNRLQEELSRQGFVLFAVR